MHCFLSGQFKPSPGENLVSNWNMAAPCGLQSYTGMDRRTWKMSFKQTRLKWRCLTIISAPPLVKTKKSISGKTPHTNCQAGWRSNDLDFCFSNRTSALYSYWVNYKLFHMPKYCTVKCKTFRPTAKNRSWNRTVIPSTPTNLDFQKVWKR